MDRSVEGALLLEGVLYKRRCSKMSSLMVRLAMARSARCQPILCLFDEKASYAGKGLGSTVVRVDEQLFDLL